MSGPSHRGAITEHEEANESEDPIADRKKSNWKPLMVVTLKATERVLDGLPIPAAKGCISIILKVIETTDVAAENQDILKELQARYEDLTEFLRSLITTEIPATIRNEARALDKRLGKLAKRWEPRLTKPRKWGYFMKLFGAHDERDTLNKFLNKTNQAINDFLLRIEVKSCILNYREIINTQHAAILSLIPHAPHASYKSARANGARTCLPGTRKSVLATVKNWAMHPIDPQHPPIFWLNGLAGIGKTTIARTLAAYLDAEHRLGGSFVFLRTDDQLKDGNLLFPTFALQLSSMFPAYKTRLAEEVESYPSCVTQSPAVQFERLIRRPLSAVPISEPLILILDALDECQPDDLAEEILDVLMKKIIHIPLLRVFITSRPEGHIREALGLDLGARHFFRRQALVLHQDIGVQAEVEGDIRLYLQTTLQETWDKDSNQSGTIWPREEDLETLVQQSGKLFIYAATAVRFIGGNRSLNLEMQLQNLLKVEKNHVPSNEVEPYMHLDQLYLNILKTAFAGITDTKDQYYRARFQKIVGSIVLMQRPLPLEALAKFLRKYSVDDIKQTLYYLHSIFIVPDKISEVPRIYHLSFPNFITHPDRCTNKNAYINPHSQEKYLFLRCLATMEEHFGPAIESGRPNTTRQDTVDLLDDEDDNESANTECSSSLGSSFEDDIKSERGDDLYDGDVLMTLEAKYSCNHWCSHLISIEAGDTETTKYLARFTKYYFSQWLDQRVDRMSSAAGTRKIKLARDTFDILHDVHRWAAASHEAADSQRNRSIRRVIRRSARKAHQTLFPQSDLQYRFGNRIHYPSAQDGYLSEDGRTSLSLSRYSTTNIGTDQENESGPDWASSASGGAYSR